MANTRTPRRPARCFASSLYCPGKLLWTNRTSVITMAGLDECFEGEQLAIVQLRGGFEFELRRTPEGLVVGCGSVLDRHRDRRRHQLLGEQACRRKING